jgi:hypothetical protein
MALSCPQNRTARRVGSKTRLWFGKLIIRARLPSIGSRYLAFSQAFDIPQRSCSHAQEITASALIRMGNSTSLVAPATAIPALEVGPEVPGDVILDQGVNAARERVKPSLLNGVRQQTLGAP